MIRVGNAPITRQDDTTKTHLLATVENAVLCMDCGKFRRVEARGNSPLHYNGSLHGVQVYIHGGQPAESGVNVGRLEVKAKVTKNRSGGSDLTYYSVNLHLVPGMVAENAVTLTYDGSKADGGETWGADHNGSFVIVKPLAPATTTQTATA